MEHISIALSLIATTISIATLLYEMHWNRSQLRIDFFHAHFKEALNKLIPDARKNLFFREEKLVNYENLQEILAKMRQNADFFKYYSPSFYEAFKKQNQKIEDYIGETLNKKCDEDRQTKFSQTIDKELQKLYKIITQEYFG